MIRSFATRSQRALAQVLAIACVSAPSSALAVSCTVSTLPANFGTYNPLLAAPSSTTGEIDVACTCAITDCVVFGYRIELSAGSSGDAAARQMRADAATLAYNLYSDAAFSSIWGSGSAGYSTLYLIALFGSKQALTVYARMPAGQAVAAGYYSDAPVVTIFY